MACLDHHFWTPLGIIDTASVPVVLVVVGVVVLGLLGLLGLLLSTKLVLMLRLADLLVLRILVHMRLLGDYVLLVIVGRGLHHLLSIEALS